MNSDKPILLESAVLTARGYQEIAYPMAPCATRTIVMVRYASVDRFAERNRLGVSEHIGFSSRSIYLVGPAYAPWTQGSRSTAGECPRERRAASTPVGSPLNGGFVFLGPCMVKTARKTYRVHLAKGHHSSAALALGLRPEATISVLSLPL